MKKIIFILTLMACDSLFASLDNPLKSDYIDFSKINLNSYVTQKDPEVLVEKMQSQEDAKVTAYFIFRRKLNDLEKKLIMHAFDLNGDGRIDMVKHFLNKVNIKTEFDLDYDGKVEDVSEYDSTTGKLLKKTLAQGAANMWRYWHNEELRLMELDRNNDKKPDMWVHYRKGAVVKTEVDANYDGKQIREEK